MERAPAALTAARAVGRLVAGGPWVGFGYRAEECRFVVGAADGVRDRTADRDVLLALAIAYFTEAVEAPPSDLEATQSDLSVLMRHLIAAEPDPAHGRLLGEALDAIDDGLAGDAVAEKLQAARSPRDDAVDPLELLWRNVREIAPGG